MKAHELTSTLSEIPYRRGSYLSEERKNLLLDVRTQVQIIEQQVSLERGHGLGPAKKDRLIQPCRKSSVTLRENLGTIKGRLDVGGKQ